MQHPRCGVACNNAMTKTCRLPVQAKGERADVKLLRSPADRLGHLRRLPLRRWYASTWAANPRPRMTRLRSTQRTSREHRLPRRWRHSGVPCSSTSRCRPREAWPAPAVMTLRISTVRPMTWPFSAAASMAGNPACARFRHCDTRKRFRPLPNTTLKTRAMTASIRGRRGADLGRSSPVDPRASPAAIVLAI